MKRRRFITATLVTVGTTGCLGGGGTDFSGDGSGGGTNNESSNEEETTVERGESSAVGDGEATTYAVTEDEEVTAVGIRLTEGALEDLGDETVKAHLGFPESVDGTPFEFAGIDWSRGGHEPEGVYNVPHFDIHFYMVPEEEVEEIQHIRNYDTPIAEDQMPPGYVRTNEVVPEMGEHLIDPNGREFEEGNEFTHTFVWGAYEGDLTFYEPMIANEFLEGLEASEVGDEIKTPERMPEAGDYPTEYSIEHDDEDGAYDVELLSFEGFEASEV